MIPDCYDFFRLSRRRLPNPPHVPRYETEAQVTSALAEEVLDPDPNYPDQDLYRVARRWQKFLKLAQARPFFRKKGGTSSPQSFEFRSQFPSSRRGGRKPR